MKKKLNMRYTISFLLFLFLVSGCEYKLHDNFIELEPPSDDPGVEVFLNVESDGATLYIPEYSRVQFSLETSGKNIRYCAFKLGSQEWTFSSTSGEFWISGAYMSNHTLRCDIYIENNTGSIAQQLGEGLSYCGYEWIVEYITAPNPSLTHKVNEDGFIELSWDKPRISESSFNCYKIYYSYKECATITDINRLSYVCKPYCGGFGDFYVVMEFKDGRQWDLGRINFYDQKIKINVDYSVDDIITLSWDNPYNSAVNITVGGNLLVSFVKEKSVSIPRRSFGAYTDYVEFLFNSYNEEDRSDDSRFSIWGSIYLGLGVSLGGNLLTLGYNKSDDMLYVSSYTETKNLLYPNFEKYREYVGADRSSYNRYASSIYDGKMAVQHSGSIELIEGKEMKSVKTISSYPFQYFTGPMTFTSNGKLVCFVYDNSYKGLVYNAETGVLESYIDIPVQYWDINNMQISSDARYLVIPRGGYGLDVYIIENYKLVKVGELNIDASYWCLNPLKSGELFVSYGGYVRLYDCRTLSMVAEWSYPDMNVGNIDPKTGNLLLFNSTSIQIINPEAKQLLYTLPVGNLMNVRLYGNALVSESGFALNLSKFIAK